MWKTMFVVKEHKSFSFRKANFDVFCVIFNATLPYYNSINTLLSYPKMGS